MYCTKKIASDLVWVGANDRRLAMFEGVYRRPGRRFLQLLSAARTKRPSCFDTVDQAVQRAVL